LTDETLHNTSDQLHREIEYNHFNDKHVVKVMVSEASVATEASWEDGAQLNQTSSEGFQLESFATETREREKLS
jgi:hypothetical protein